MLIRREAILAKVESTYRTDSTPGATDAVFINNPSWGSEANMLERAGVKDTLAPFQQVFGGALRTVSFECELKGSGTIDVPPEIGVLLKGCGLGETINAGVSVVYEPVSTAIDSLTIYYYQDGKLKKMTGARGNCTFTLAAGELLKANFEFTGHPVSPDVDAAIIDPTYDTTVPPAFKDAAFSIGGYSAAINQLEINLGNEIAKPRNVSTSNAYGEIRIASRDINGSFDPEEVLVATNDFYADWEAGNAGSMDTGTVGSTAGNRVRFQLPIIHYRDISEADREGIRTLNTSYGATETSGDDEMTLTFS